MQQGRFEEHVGAENICPNVQAALDRAVHVYQDGLSLKKQFGARATVPAD
jgi:exonuclease VII small subunit